MTCPRLHWTTENPSGLHKCQFQHICLSILNCALTLAIYIFVVLILILWHKETHINPQRNWLIIGDPAGIELTTSRLRQLHHLPVDQHVRFTPLKLRKKRNPNVIPESTLDNRQPVWNAQVSISTPVCVNFELPPGGIHNFDVLAQGNVYKPSKEPINYRGPCGDRTQDLQTKATPPAASWPARALHSTEIT